MHVNFNLHTPCKDCPFRTDVKPYLRPDRVMEICANIIERQQTFACHKTTEHDEDGDPIHSNDEQHCAGALVFLERLERPNQLMRIAERFGQYDRRKLDMTAPVYRTPTEMARAQRNAAIRPQPRSPTPSPTNEEEV